MADTELPSQDSNALTTEQVFQQAILHHQAGRLQEAEKLYRIIIQSQPNHPDANHNLGVIAVQVNQSIAALPHFKTSLHVNPNQTQYWLSYIHALIETGSFNDAQRVLKQGQQQGLCGDAVNALEERLNKEIQAVAREKIDEDKKKQIELLTDGLIIRKSTKKSTNGTKKAKQNAVLQQGKSPHPEKIKELMALFAEQRYTEAVPIARSLTCRFPQHPFGWKALGVVYKQLCRNEDALVCMEKSVLLLPSDAEAHNNLGATLRDLGRNDEAVESYRSALKIKPDYLDALNNLGVTLKELGQFNDAELIFRRILQIKPDIFETYYNLGIALHAMGRLFEAEICYRRALAINPEYAEAYNNLGITFQVLYQHKEAEIAYRKALQIKPNFAEGYYNLGVALHSLGRLNDAVYNYQLSLKIKSDFIDVHINLGVTFQEQGELYLTRSRLRIFQIAEILDLEAFSLGL